MNGLEVFKLHTNNETFDLAQANFLIAKNVAYPDLSVEDCLGQLDALAMEAAQTLPFFTTIEDRAISLANFLFNSVEFSGNDTDYYAADNSYLNCVLDTKSGIPISLSTLYIEIARRLEMEAYGIGLPGHFVVGVHTDDEPIIFDPFNAGQILTVEDCRNLIAATQGALQGFQSTWLEPSSHRDIVTRMLNNLRQIYISGEQWAQALDVVRHLFVLQPDIATHQRDLGLLYYRNKQLRQAAHYLSEYLRHSPNADDARTVKHSLKLVLDKFSRLN